MEKFTEIVEGQNDGQEMAVTHGGLQVSDGFGLAERSTTSSEHAYGAASSEGFYLNQYDAVRQLQAGLWAYVDFYNHERAHQSLDYRTPAEEHFVLCSEPATFAQMHLIFPISWSNDWDQSLSASEQPRGTGRAG